MFIIYNFLNSNLGKLISDMHKEEIGGLIPRLNLEQVKNIDIVYPQANVRNEVVQTINKLEEF